MLFVISSALVYAYKVYTPLEYKVSINVLSCILFTLLIYSLNIKDLYVSQMKTKKRFFILNIIHLVLEYYLSFYIPTIIFTHNLLSIVDMLTSHFNLKKYNKYFGGYEIL